MRERTTEMYSILDENERICIENASLGKLINILLAENTRLLDGISTPNDETLKIINANARIMTAYQNIIDTNKQIVDTHVQIADMSH